MTRFTPENLQAEDQLVGACLLSTDAIAAAYPVVSVSDFRQESNGLVFAAAVEMWRDGQQVDATTVADHLRRSGSLERVGGAKRLVLLSASPASLRSAGRYALIVAEMAVLRRIIQVGSDIVDDGYAAGDPSEVIDRAKAALAGVELPVAPPPKDLWDVDEFLDRPETERAPWVIPGLLRQDWRCVIVAPEGIGKSVLLRQCALLAAQGVHPLAFTDMKPIRALVVDLENPDEAIVGMCDPIRAQLARVRPYERGRTHLWHRPGGINLRSRTDRASFEAVLVRTKPDLVCLGPVYKSFRRLPREDHEQATEEAQQVLDDLRTRHKFALLLEHHAPKKQAGVRDIEPYGSQRWLAWPELGIGLIPQDEGNERMRLKRWRGDRLPASWPEEVHRHNPWPWAGKWNRSNFGAGEAA